MSEWIVPIACALLALAGGLYATRGKQATDRADQLDRRFDQMQEEVTAAEAKVIRRDELIRAERAENERLRRLRQYDADYIVRLRRQIEDGGQEPLPYPGLDR